MTRRGRVLSISERRSIALSRAEHHHRETQRTHQMSRWAALAGVALAAAAVLANWISTPLGLFLFAVAVWVLLSAVVRFQAALSRNLLDPYRARESWEPPDWWNH